MPKLINLSGVSDDTFITVELDSAPTTAQEVTANTLLPLDTYIQLADSLTDAACGVWLSSADDAERLKPYLNKLSVIACRFVAFADGRSFSQARTLRDKFEFKGEIRAIGGFIQDQLFYLKRCGFDAFAVSDDADLESLQESLSDFSDSYQSGCDIQTPLFRRRA